MSEMGPMDQEARDKQAVKAILTSPVAKSIAVAILSQAGIGAAKSFANRMALKKARKLNEAAVDPSLASKLPGYAEKRYNIKPSVVKSDNAVTRLIGPVYSPEENEIVGPSNTSRAKRPLTGTLDEPAVLAHELGHAVVAKKTPRISRAGPMVQGLVAPLVLGATMTGSPILAALLTAAGSVPRIVEERRANIHAKKILTDAVGKPSAKKLIRANHWVEGAGAGTALATAAIAGAVAHRMRMATAMRDKANIEAARAAGQL